ncbi:ketopantoate reductase family protein [Clostridium sp. BSD9I1]|uniref:ketopantoate reductase family protein n=1 Tax=Clostridium sp. BSD9I1 TaxID=2003589 RepID=UPI0016464B10|nr:ketopantoate reductase family protein [Clostridium sp. BSD9I1]
MKVAILGCGAMGTVLGAYLTQKGCEVELIDSYKEHVDALNYSGAHIVGTVDFTVPVKAITPDQMEGIYDIVFLFTKQTSNEEVLPKLLPYLGPDSTVCTLQNGVPEPFVANYVGKERTVGGTVLWGATFIEPGVSELTQDLSRNDHLFEIGEIDGSITPRIQAVADVLNFMGHTKVSDSLMASRWGKLINNACMSGMSAACGCTFGEVLDNDIARACLSYLGKEVKLCCEAAGYKLPTLLHEQSPETLDLIDQAMFNADQEMFLNMYSDMRAAKASMLQDLEKKKPTEVRMINGYVCQTGDKYGIDTPFNDKVVEIVSKIENGELPLSMNNVNLFDRELFTYDLYNI